MVSIYNKVAWLEGMLLKAQHFQQQERYFESLLHQHTAAQFPYYWGFSQLHLDRTLLELGKLGLKEASGIFPDGTAFKIPGLDKAPDPIEFKNSEDEAFLYLSIPLQSESQYQQDLNGEEGRYQLKELSANDTYQDTHNPQIIKICQTRLQLIFAKNPPENTPYLSVAKLNKSSEKNRVQIDESFIPPCLNIGCSQEILSACRYFIEKIKGITESISPSYKKRNSPQAALLLQYLLILKKQQALLEHHLESQAVHPEKLYQEWRVFSSELGVIHQDEFIHSPSYQHNQLKTSLEGIIDFIKKYLDKKITESLHKIVLTEIRTGLWKSDLLTEHQLSKKIILSIAPGKNSYLHGDELVNHIKLGTELSISTLINKALPGISLHKIENPATMPELSQQYCYQVEQGGELWIRVLNEHRFVLHGTTRLGQYQASLWYAED